MLSRSIMGNKWKALGGTEEKGRGRERGDFLKVGRLFGKLNWDSRGRDVSPAAGLLSSGEM